MISLLFFMVKMVKLNTVVQWKLSRSLFDIEYMKNIYLEGVMKRFLQ